VRWLVPGLAAIGGLCAGAAATGLVVLSLGAWPAQQATLALAAPAADGFETAAVVDDPRELVVDVAGAVAEPGLHRLRAGTRVGDAIAAAGGFAPRADLAATSEALNLALPLEDGAKVLVPELGLDRVTGGTAADESRIDLNRASRSELESLPGIGPVTAGKIMAARDSQRFDAVAELRSRGLVGEKVYADIKGLLRTS
jgi:competence protein ComEA